MSRALATWVSGPVLHARPEGAFRLRESVSVGGEDGLSPSDRQFLAFGERFEHGVVHQSGESRDLEQSIAAGWSALRGLRPSELHRLSDAQIKAHLEQAGEPARAEA